MVKPARLRRIVVIGNTGAGKSTLAGQLAAKLGVPHVELDALHWEANWVAAPTDRFRERVSQAVAGERWVMDGNYSRVRDISWGAADTIIWLDYPLWLTFGRLLRRTLKRVFLRTELWHGNRERFADQFLSRENSLFLWALKSHGKHRREWPVVLARPEYAHLTVVRLQSPQQTARWLASLSEDLLGIDAGQFDAHDQVLR